MKCECGKVHLRDEAFYVSVRDAYQTGLLLGPFQHHKDALSWVERVRTKAEEITPWAHFYSFGTVGVSLSKVATVKSGSLNAKMGVTLKEGFVQC